MTFRDEDIDGARTSSRLNPVAMTVTLTRPCIARSITVPKMMFASASEASWMMCADSETS